MPENKYQINLDEGFEPDIVYVFYCVVPDYVFSLPKRPDSINILIHE